MEEREKKQLLDAAGLKPEDAHLLDDMLVDKGKPSRQLSFRRNNRIATTDSDGANTKKKKRDKKAQDKHKRRVAAKKARRQNRKSKGR